MESYSDQIERVKLMSQGRDDEWADLREDDLAALETVLDDRRMLVEALQAFFNGKCYCAKDAEGHTDHGRHCDLTMRILGRIKEPI